MKLILYNNHSEFNKIDKDIIKIIELEGFLREASSLINPLILIELDPKNYGVIVDDNRKFVIYNNEKISWESFTNKVLSANYVYIYEFKRYYFINDIVSVRNNLWRISLSVDVAMSYQEEIKNLQAFVTRNEFKYDPLVKDDEISYYYDKDVIEYTPEKGNKVNTTFKSNSDDPQPISPYDNNVIITAINNNNLDVRAIVTPPDDGLPIVSNDTSGQSVTYDVYATSVENVSRLAKRLIADDTLYNFLLSVIIFPFAFDVVSEFSYIRLGNTEFYDEPYVRGYHLNPSLSKYFVIADFTIKSNDFKDYEPFTQYQIWLPYLAWVNINADDILNNRIIVYYTINFQTGSAQVTIYDCTNKKVIFTSNCQLGVKLGLSSTNTREVQDNENSNNIGLGVGLLTSVLAIAGGVASYNPVAVAGGMLAGGSSIAHYIQNQNTNYYRAYGSISNANGGLYLPQDVRIRQTKLKPKNYNEDYFKLKGRPLNKTTHLYTLKGFTTIGDVHLENFGSATKQETDLIKNLLERGIIL